jgi:trk system potassium uptake protein
MELFDRVTGGAARLSAHARTALGTSALLYLAATVPFALMLVPWSADGLPTGAEVKAAATSASALAVNARGAGIPFEFASGYPRAIQWLLVVLMAVGANPAGTGGGVKATTVVQLIGGIRAALRGQRVPRAFGVAAVWLGVYLGIVVGGMLLLLWRVADIGGDRLLFLTVSAASNVGLAHDPVSITGPGLYTLCAVMLAGRVAPVFVLSWMARTTTDAEVAVA